MMSSARRVPDRELLRRSSADKAGYVSVKLKTKEVVFCFYIITSDALVSNSSITLLHVLFLPSLVCSKYRCASHAPPATLLDELSRLMHTGRPADAHHLSLSHYS